MRGLEQREMPSWHAPIFVQMPSQAHRCLREACVHATLLKTSRSERKAPILFQMFRAFESLMIVSSHMSLSLPVLSLGFEIGASRFSIFESHIARAYLSSSRIGEEIHQKEFRDDQKLECALK